MNYFQLLDKHSITLNVDINEHIISYISVPAIL